MQSSVKRMLGLVLAIALLIPSCFSHVFAAGSGEITVKGTTTGKEYSIYKVFDLTQSGKNVSYTIAKEWEAFFKTGAGKDYIKEDNSSGLNAIFVDGKIKYINITKGNVAEFAKAAMGEIGKIKPTDTKKATGDTLTFKGLDLGYYLVYPKGATEKKDGQTSIVSLTSTTPKADVEVKGTYPTIDKKVEKPSADYGEARKYTLTSKVPDTTGYSEYKYEITDTLSKGLTLDKDSIKVMINGQALNKGTDFNVSVTKGSDESTVLKITGIDMLKQQANVGKKVEITYSASLNEKAIIGNVGNPNKVDLEFSNDPHDKNKTDHTGDDEKLYTGAIKVIKHEKGNEQKLLKGAKFKLKNEQNKFYKLVNGKVTWVDENQGDEKVTNEQGVVEFKGLKNGKYFLVETMPPAGYNQLPAPVEVNIDYKNQTTTAYQEAKVANSSGAELPPTGGMGTKLFLALGGAMILAAGYNLSKSRVKKETK